MAEQYLGSKLSLITNSLIRYEGILESIDINNCTLKLANVKMFGTESRPAPTPIPPTMNKTYKCITFKGNDIKDIFMCEETSGPQSSLNASTVRKVPPADPELMVDPAIIDVEKDEKQQSSASLGFQWQPQQQQTTFIPGGENSIYSDQASRKSSPQIDQGTQVTPHVKAFGGAFGGGAFNQQQARRYHGNNSAVGGYYGNAANHPPFGPIGSAMMQQSNLSHNRGFGPGGNSGNFGPQNNYNNYAQPQHQQPYYRGQNNTPYNTNFGPNNSNYPYNQHSGNNAPPFGFGSAGGGVTYNKPPYNQVSNFAGQHYPGNNNNNNNNNNVNTTSAVKQPFYGYYGNQHSVAMATSSGADRYHGNKQPGSFNSNRFPNNMRHLGGNLMGGGGGGYYNNSNSGGQNYRNYNTSYSNRGASYHNRGGYHSNRYQNNQNNTNNSATATVQFGDVPPPSEDFDFEASNQAFDKEAAAREFSERFKKLMMSKTEKKGDLEKTSNLLHSGGDDEIDNKNDNSGGKNSTANIGHETEEEKDKDDGGDSGVCCYDSKLSFWDTISCQTNLDKQRDLFAKLQISADVHGDSETSAHGGGGGAFRRGNMRGRGGGGGYNQQYRSNYSNNYRGNGGQNYRGNYFGSARYTNSSTTFGSNRNYNPNRGQPTLNRNNPTINSNNNPGNINNKNSSLKTTSVHSTPQKTSTNNEIKAI